MQRLRSLAATAVAMALLAAGPARAQSTATLQGTVTDSATSLPIDGASVQISGGFSTSTNAAGGYARDLPQGTYSVTFSKAGYETRKPVLAIKLVERGSPAARLGRAAQNTSDEAVPFQMDEAVPFQM